MYVIIKGNISCIKKIYYDYLFKNFNKETKMKVCMKNCKNLFHVYFMYEVSSPMSSI